MIHLKPGVTLDRIAPAGYVLLTALKESARQLGHDLTITSGDDGTHSGPLDPHKWGEAYDVRSHDLPVDIKARLVPLMMDILGESFYGVLESVGTSHEHFHFQRTRGTVFHVLDWLQT